MLPTLFRRVAPCVRRAAPLLLTLATMGLPLYLPPAQASQPEGPASLAQAAGGAAETQHLGVEEILVRHYEAIGGDRRRQVQTMRISGTSIVMGMEAPYTRWSKRPNKFLLEIYVQGMTGIQAFDGETAWSFMPFMGQSAPAAMPPAQALAVREGADFDGALLTARGNGHRIELLATLQVNGRYAYALQITMKSGNVQTHYVDTETFYTTRVESAEGDALFLDYRIVDGHPVPSVIEMMGPMGEQTICVDDIEFGVDIADGRFRMQ